MNDFETYYILRDGNETRKFKNRKGVVGDAKTRAYKAYEKAIKTPTPSYMLYRYVSLSRGSEGCLEQTIEIETVGNNLK